MTFLSKYAASIITVSLLALLLESILPGGSHKKYATMVIGLMVMLVILNPLTELPHYDAMFSLPQLYLSETDISPPVSRPYVAEQFEKKLALSISEGLHQVYGTTVACRVSCQTNEIGQIKEIKSVRLEPYSAEFAAYVVEEYGIEKECITP